MNLQEYKGERKFCFYTRQVSAMWESLRREGSYRVRREYIEEKNDTIADYYLKLYRWYTRMSRRYLSLPADAEYPIWLSINPDNMLQPVEGTVILRLEIPEEEFLLCNYEGWGYVVNYFYVPLNEEDERQHKEKLRRSGMASDDELFLTDKGNFYPLLKREVEKSWERIFTLLPDDRENNLVATCWELKREWVKEVLGESSE